MRAVIIGDTHFPWVDKAALTQATKLITRDTELVVQIGDLYDWYASSRFPRSMNYKTPEEETHEARQMAVEMWLAARRRAPKAKLVQLLGNHCDRPLKRARTVVPELEHLVQPKIKELYTFQGVHTILESNEDYEQGGIVFTHGFLPRVGDHARVALMPVVRGHTHVGKLTWVRPRLWEMDVGYLGDSSAHVFNYQTWRRSYKMTLGCGVVDEYGPRFVEFAK